jgi:hypothetical protein
MTNVKAEDQDPRSLKVLALAEAFGNGQAIDAKELEAAARAAHTATYTAYAAATYAAAYAAHTAAYTAYAATYTAYATAYAAYAAATSAASTEELKDYLIDTISKEFNDLELMLMRS